MFTLFSPLHPQKLIRMNMPVTEAGTVHFTTTLFALIRESLSIKMGPGRSLYMDRHYASRLLDYETKTELGVLFIRYHSIAGKL